MCVRESERERETDRQRERERKRLAESKQIVNKDERVKNRALGGQFSFANTIQEVYLFLDRVVRPVYQVGGCDLEV